MHELFSLKTGDHISVCLPDGSRFELRQGAGSFEMCDRDGKTVFARVMGKGQASAAKDVYVIVEGGIVQEVFGDPGVRGMRRPSRYRVRRANRRNGESGR